MKGRFKELRLEIFTVLVALLSGLMAFRVTISISELISFQPIFCAGWLRTSVCVLLGMALFYIYYLTFVRWLEKYLQYKLADKYLRSLLPFRDFSLVKVLCLLTGNTIQDRERSFLLSLLQGKENFTGSRFVANTVNDLDADAISSMLQILEEKEVATVADLNLFMRRELHRLSDGERRFLIGLHNNWEKYIAGKFGESYFAVENG
ncbi:MAG: hypothetical protein M5Z89_10130 [Olivibacter sp.]|nr:hypothetical protein [Olivibacter sp. UJ_SKK_5.1]